MIMGNPCDDVAGKVLRVSRSDYDEPETRAGLLAIHIGLTLPREEVDELIAVGEAMSVAMAGRSRGSWSPGLKPPHPEARIAHRGICASPDAIFGSHRRQGYPNWLTP
jgi:hypothetical protein